MRGLSSTVIAALRVGGCLRTSCISPNKWGDLHPEQDKNRFQPVCSRREGIREKYGVVFFVTLARCMFLKEEYSFLPSFFCSTDVGFVYAVGNYINKTTIQKKYAEIINSFVSSYQLHFVLPFVQLENCEPSYHPLCSIPFSDSFSALFSLFIRSLDQLIRLHGGTPTP